MDGYVPFCHPILLRILPAAKGVPSRDGEWNEKATQVPPTDFILFSCDNPGCYDYVLYYWNF